MSQNMHVEPSASLSKRYTLNEKIWQGGRTSVYRATHIQLGREVALKLISSEFLTPTTITRFQQEARAIARLQHPNILQIYDFDLTDDGSYFMATEYFPNGDLQRQLDRLEARRERLNIPQVLHIIKSVALALQYAHSQGIIHRDIKPSNIFLDGPMRVVVGDFGLAKLYAGFAETSTPGMMVGTPAYMSPEQATGGAVDHRTDIYAMGGVLYYLLVGQRLYSGDSIADLVSQHLYSPVPDVTKARPDVPPALKAILEKALAKKPEDRYASVGLFLEDLQGLEAGLDESDHTLNLESGVSLTPGALGTTTESKHPSRPHGVQVTPSTQSWEIHLGLTIPYWKIGLFVAMLALLIGVVALYGWQRRSEPEHPNTASVPTIVPAQADEILVVVAAMVDTKTGVDFARRVVDWLATGDVSGLLNDRLRIEAWPTAIESEAEALQIGQASQANIVIWGQQQDGVWQVNIQAPQHPAGSLQKLQLTAPDTPELQVVLNQQVPELTDLYVRVLLMADLAQQGDLLGVFYLTFTLKGMDETLPTLAATPLDQNVVETILHLTLAEGVEAEGTASSGLEFANADATLYYLRWAAHALAGQVTAAHQDINQLVTLLPGSDFPEGLRYVTYYMAGDTATAIRASQNLQFSTTTSYSTAFSLVQQLLIGEGQFAAVQANVAAYDQWFAAQGIDNADQAIVDVLSYLYYIQGDRATLTSVEAEFRDFRESRFYVVANGFFREVQPTNFAPVSFSVGGYGETTLGDVSQARLTYTFGLLQHPDYFLLNWQQGQLDEADGKFQQAYDHYENAANNAPGPFPPALFDQARLVMAHGDELEKPRPACEILGDALTAAQTDRVFYSARLVEINQLRSQAGCD